MTDALIIYYDVIITHNLIKVRTYLYAKCEMFFYRSEDISQRVATNQELK